VQSREVTLRAADIPRYLPSAAQDYSSHLEQGMNETSIEGVLPFYIIACFFRLPVDYSPFLDNIITACLLFTLWIVSLLFYLFLA
jgi:hypothetical protein